MEWPEILKKLLAAPCQYADIFYEKVRQSLISLEENCLEKVISGEEEGIGLRIIAGNRSFYAHTNDLTRSNLISLADEMVLEVRGDGEKIFLSREDRPMIPGEARESLEISDKIELVKLANRVARGYDPLIRQVGVTLIEKEQELFILGPGREAQGVRFGTIMAVQAVAADGEALERGYEVESLSRKSDFLTEELVEDLARRAAARAVKMVRAQASPAGEMPVILSAQAGGTMVHEAIGHGLENDLAGQGFSVYSGNIGQEVASPLISVVDDPTIPDKRGSYIFDDEGTPARKNILVEKGRLLGFISDILSASRFGGEPTGNGRRQSYRFLPIPRMSNTTISPGKEDPENIIRQTKKGLLVIKMGGGQVNTVNGDFVFEVSEAYRLEEGRIGPPVRGALLIGNGPDVLREIDVVGHDLGFAVGTCGKEGQQVPVSDAQPTLRIPRMVVGGRLKGQ